MILGVVGFLVLVGLLPLVLRFLEGQRMRSYDSVGDVVSTAAKKYMKDHSAELPTELGTSTTVDIEKLYNKGYLHHELVDPETNKKVNGVVRVTQIDTDEYRYQAGFRFQKKTYLEGYDLLGGLGNFQDRDQDYVGDGFTLLTGSASIDTKEVLCASELKAQLKKVSEGAGTLVPTNCKETNQLIGYMSNYGSSIQSSSILTDPDHVYYVSGCFEATEQEALVTLGSNTLTIPKADSQFYSLLGKRGEKDTITLALPGTETVGQLSAKYVYVFDLTEIYGGGKEPKQDDMDRIVKELYPGYQEGALCKTIYDEQSLLALKK